MLTYDLSKIEGTLYEGIYAYIKKDIEQGHLCAHERMPSKRMLAKHLGVSTITVENAYEQLVSEGYLYTRPRSGYFVSNIEKVTQYIVSDTPKLDIHYPTGSDSQMINVSNNRTDPEDFPFSVWARLMRRTMSDQEDVLLKDSTCGGVYILRKAIADHLASFRGMVVDPDQIIVGAGTEYLYSLLIQLLGQEKTICLEDPGYRKIAQIYQSYHVKCTYADMDADGISLLGVLASQADIVHISPTHHFPTGITMPINRRYELLRWASQKEGRIIIEDDYDSEFRLNGRPIPPLQTIDEAGHVIYMNTFSKSLAPTIRISYMVLPRHLANRYYEKLSFYTCTVSTFEQYTLAAFIQEGYFEKHINRMRLVYGRKRLAVMEALQKNLQAQDYEVIENDSGLHFILKLHIEQSDDFFMEQLHQKGIHLQAIKDFYFHEEKKDTHAFLVNYTSIHPDDLDVVFSVLNQTIQSTKTRGI